METPQQDVLVGVLATRLGLAPRGGAAAAQRATGGAAGLPLSDTLVSAGALTQEQLALVTSLSARALDEAGGDVGTALARLGGQRALDEAFDGALTLADDGRVTTCDDAERAELAAVTWEHPQRYTLGKRRDRDPSHPDADTIELGRGGIGRVVIAFDEHLGREVAVKELLPHRAVTHTSDTDQRLSLQTTRFLREARVTGQLEHPNIIPVYELGRRADGTLYYTMKVVRGRTLAEALRETRTTAERLKLLTHFADLCDAIAYAHSRGVVHRDIKPDNVMVGAFGETVVLDWGLAKPAHGDDPRAAEMARALEALRDGDQARTMDGTLLGTPLYMSPEQARGDLAGVDARSDVYSLGAVLYELLTGRPPFSGATTLELLLAVLSAPLPPVRSRCADAPPELAAVAEKALSRDASGRYPDASALAEEIRAWLTGARVHAYAYSARELLRRWAARHKVALAVAGVAAALLVALGALSWSNVVAERNRAVAAEAEARREQARAVAAEGEARASAAEALRAEGDAARARDGAEGLVRFMVRDLRERLEPLGQLALLDEVVVAIDGYYRDHAPSAGTEAAERTQSRASALALLADLQAARGELSAATATADEALALRQALVGRPELATVASVKGDYGASLRQVGALAEARGDLARAEASYAAARAALDEATRMAPDDLEVARERSLVRMDQGDVAAARGDGAAAEAAYRDAVALREALVAADAEEPRWRHALAEAHDRLGHALVDAGREAEAQRAYAQAHALRAALVAAHPGQLGWQHELASSHALLGDAALGAGDGTTAEARYHEALALLEGLVRADPANRRWQRDLVTALNRVGDAAAARGDAVQAQARYGQALERMQALVTLAPDNAAWRRDLAVGHNRVGDGALRAGQPAAALEAYEAALTLATALAEADPEHATWQHDLALTEARVGGAAAALGRGADAIAAYTAAEGRLAALVARAGAQPGWGDDHEAVRAALAKVRAGGAPGVGDPVGAQVQRGAGGKSAKDLLEQIQRPGAMKAAPAPPPGPPAPPATDEELVPRKQRQRPTLLRGDTDEPPKGNPL